MMCHVRRVGLSAAIIAVASHLGFAQTSAPVAQQFDKLHFRSIGPAIMSGRIADLAVYEKNTSIWYVGTAHGGVWKTTSNGATFTPMLQDQGLMSIGDVTVSQQNPDVVWVGTGEVEQPPDHVVGRRRLEVHRRRQDVPEHRTQGLEAHQPDPHRSERTTTSCSSRRPDRSSVRAAIAASTRRPTAARRGSACCSSTTRRARTIS